MTAATGCRICGTEPRAGARFCDGCGAPVAEHRVHAEYKQVTVLFADVVHSMEIAATVGPERLREIMAELAGRCAAVVQRCGGTVDKFTGDGVMAVFGAPVALEDHAIRACMAALGIQHEAGHLAAEVRRRDDVNLQLRIGLNSGQVIAGEIGSGPFGYTAVGEQVGIAQRMESVAPPAGVMLSASTARLVRGAARLGEVEQVQIKGAAQPMPAYRLLGMGEEHHAAGPVQSNLVGRRSEMAAVEALLDRAGSGQGALVGVVGSPGIGKSRVVREVAGKAAARGVDVFSIFCESHTSDIPFHVVARLLRAVTGISGVDPKIARARIRAQFRDAEPEDLVLFDDLVGIADPDAELPRINPDARRRRLTSLINAATLARRAPAVYVVEDVHWIDEVSESMIADFVGVVQRTHSLVMISYRPEYRGVLGRVPGAHSVVLAPLSASETSALATELLGRDSSVRGLATMIVERAAGNPFFVEEMVRELAERGVLRGKRGGYVSAAGDAAVSVPATVQATIAARIDRLDPVAKRTLSAAAVIGARFDAGLLEGLGVEPVIEDLVAAELVDQVASTRGPEYVFHHPLIRTVAYDSQLKSARAELHRRLATAIESRDPAAAEQNAALIAEHLEAAGDLHAAYGWHMRAAAWATNRDIAAARRGWERAQTIADALPAEDPNRPAMRIAPRTMLCGTAYRVHEPVAGDCFDELRDLCAAAGDKASMAIAMAALVMDQAGVLEASQLSSEAWVLLESVGDPILTVGLSTVLLRAKIEGGEWPDILRWSEKVIEFAAGDPCRGNFIFGSPLAAAFAARGQARYCLGLPGWRDDVHRALAMARSADAMSYASVVAYTYLPGIPFGVLAADDRAEQQIEDALRIADRSGDDVALALAKMALGVALAHRPTDPERDRAQELLADVSDALLRQGYLLCDVPLANVYLARERFRGGDRDGAIQLLRATADDLFGEGPLLAWGIPATAVLVEALLDRGDDSDVAEAEAAIERLATAPAPEGLVIREIWLLRLRALLSQVQGDRAADALCRARYREMAKALGFQGHTKWAEAMP